MKIGFLAMSGIRCQNEKLLSLGLTMPGVLDRGKVIAQLPSLGLLYLAAMTPEGHELKYYEAPSDGDEPEEIYDCDLVAISSFSAQIHEAYAVSKRLRERGVKVALGGLHVSVLPEEALEHADYVFIGEGEAFWKQAVSEIEAGTARQVWNSKDFPPVSVDDLPTPRYDLLLDRPYNRFTVQTTRGCPWRCDFCASNVMLRQNYRKRPIQDIIRDIKSIGQLRKRPFIEFADDNTFVDKQWGKQLCYELAELGFNWFTETDISVADDPELLKAMHDSRCRQVLIGLESPEQNGLEGIEMKTNFKAKRWSSYKDAIRRIQGAGITVNGCFILGLDQHTPDVFQEVYDFALDANLYDVQITILTPFPGTPLYDRLHNEGRLLYPGRWDRCTLFDVNYQPKQMTVDQLQDGIYWLTERLYTKQCVDQRRRAFFK